ncbi:protein kinase domain-containing protein [Nocardia amamiensis]|uniref:protein kinase domain-containing protein n=1 Tax=Nocardia amamiensis TaxID=404578 RepID=UPI000831221D|nr:protein kinase [Nocardia amamiensis]
MQPLGASDPARIGDYRLLGVLGAGGMGRVYLGRNAGGRTVAVKVIRPDMIDAEFRERFRREVTAARRVGGRFTAPVLDADVDADPPWLATGYVAGFALADAVDTYGPFTENSLLVLTHGLVEALIAVHQAGVVHRDLKPSNVLLALDGPKVIDFGIARAIDDSKLTTTGKVIGSPGFMCPEQVTGDPIGPPADIFALGGVLVFAATGHGPFGIGETLQMLWRVVYEQPQLDDVPERLRPLVAACLTKDPAARPTLDQLLTQLTALGIPDRGGWLPGPLLEQVSRRAVELLDLDSGTIDRLEHTTLGPLDGPESATRRPADQSEPPVPGPPDSARTVSIARPTPPPQYAQSGNADHSASAQSSQRGQHHSPAFAHHHGDQTTYSPAQKNSLQLGPLTAQVPTSRRPRRALLIAGALVVAVAVAVAAFVVGAQLRAGDAIGSTTTGSIDSATATTAQPAGTKPTSSGASVTSLPNAFVGEWKGVAKDLLGSYDIIVRLNPGNVGERVGESTNTGRVLGVRCGRAETLTSASAGSVVLTAKLTDDSGGCNDDGVASRLELRPDGTISYRTQGAAGDMTGILNRTG